MPNCSGVSGAFMGPHDEFFAILQPDRITLKVYSTTTANATDSGVLTIPLPHPGLLTPAIFPGPPIFQLPMPGNNDDVNSGSEGDGGDVLVDLDNGYEEGYTEEQEYDEEQGAGALEEEEHPEDVRTGYGVLLWINKFRQIVMGSMVVEGKQEEGGQGAVEGFIVGELADGEVVVQVSWQKLLEDDDSLLVRYWRNYGCFFCTRIVSPSHNFQGLLYPKDYSFIMCNVLIAAYRNKLYHCHCVHCDAYS